MRIRILGLHIPRKSVCLAPESKLTVSLLLKQPKNIIIIMKTIAILALTAAALVSCQQQQQQVEPAPAPAPAPVVAPAK